MVAALRTHPEVSMVSDFTDEMDAPDVRFRYEGDDVTLELKEKLSILSDEFAEQWPEVPRRDLLVVDETSFRRLVWAEGLGYLLVHDVPGRRWATFGPWELCLAPRRRFQRRGDKGSGEFLKGKLLLDLRTAATSSTDLDLEEVLGVVRSSRAALRQVAAVRLRMDGDLPVVPKDPAASRPPRERHATDPVSVADERRTEAIEVRPLGPSATVDGDETWAGLAGDMAAALRAWGWASPTAVQARAIPVILAGRNVLVLGPTAGGKTEAAALPLLDRCARRRSSGRPSILVVNPLKALLQDQVHRWRTLGGLVGASAFAWHGDVTQEARREFRASPSEILLTTPESLELLMSSVSTDERALFCGLEAVVVDEVHAFVGSARGAQLASIIERLDRFVDADLQRIGLSATVSNPEDVLDWIRGGSLRDAGVIDAGPPLHGETVSLRSYTDTASAVAAIEAELGGHHSIVFTRSRRRAEELAGPLRLSTYHSSISADHKSTILEQLRNGEVPALVATSSLEMGIDVGELDLVIHDGAPNDPASYLQRLGRAGRRTGQRRLVFTTGEADDLLLILAVVTRARRGDVGALPTQRGARLVLGQQALGMAFQHTIADRAALRNTLRWSPVFRGLDDEIHQTIDHLVAGSWLLETASGLLVGREGQRRFGGGQGMVRLLATFRSVDGADVVDRNGKKIGRIDWTQLAEGDDVEGSQRIALGGRSWGVAAIDRAGGRVVVEPATGGKPPSWRGASLEVERATWETVREVLGGTELPIEMDERATLWLQAARLSWAPRLAAPCRPTPEGAEADTFAGVAVHRAVLAMLGVDGKVDGPTLELYASASSVSDRARHVLADLDAAIHREAARVSSATARGLANPELTAPAVLVAEAREFHVDADGIRRVLTLLAEWRS